MEKLKLLKILITLFQSSTILTTADEQINPDNIILDNLDAGKSSPFIDSVLNLMNIKHRTVPQLIQSNGFPLEIHTVTASDGYRTTLFRIPHGRLPSSNSFLPKKVVLLHHGVTGDSATWILNAVDKALAYRLADLNVDVWLTNNRGTQFSLGHTYLSSKRHLYWNFSFHEIGTKDVPVILDYILDVTDQPDLYYIAYSMGSSVFFIAMSEFPEYNSKIRTFIGLAPAAFVGNATTVFQVLAPAVLKYQAVHDAVLYGAMIPPEITPLLQLVGDICAPKFISQWVCFAVINALYGSDFQENNYDMGRDIVADSIGSTSSKTIYHLIQLWRSAEFHRYDYTDKNVNLQKYGQRLPPKYNLSKVTAPVVLNGGDGDTVVSQPDVEKLRDSLPNVVECRQVKWPQFNHIDFVFAKNINPLVNDRIIEIIEKDLFYKSPVY